MMQTIALPEPGYTIREAEAILGFSEKYLYKLAQQDKVVLYVDSTGQYRISKEEVYRILRNREG